MMKFHTIFVISLGSPDYEMFSKYRIENILFTGRSESVLISCIIMCVCVHSYIHKFIHL